MNREQQQIPKSLSELLTQDVIQWLLANSLSKEGFKVNSIKTDAKVHLEKLETGFTITKIELNTVGDVAGIDAATFAKFAEQTKSDVLFQKL